MNKAIVCVHSAVLTAGLLLFAGCQTFSDIGASVGEATGRLSPQEAESLRRAGVAVGRTFQDITPEQEYYIGRSVSATILSTYRPYNDEAATTYLNLLGQSLALASDKPETFGGYRFLILDSDEINAFAAPGGFIFVTRGMLRLCRTEDELAAVLAHEIGHIQERHGLQAIRSSRLTTAFTVLALEATRNLAGDEVRTLTEAFEESIGDITHTLMAGGYSRRAEREADVAAVAILRRVGYSPAGLIRMLEEMDRQLVPGGLDFARTHPPPPTRIRDVRRSVGAGGAPAAAPAARRQRFAEAMNGI
jgi:beta-barrel assembly-enhancing protease